MPHKKQKFSFSADLKPSFKNVQKPWLVRGKKPNLRFLTPGLFGRVYGNSNNYVEQLKNRLISKIASTNNLNEKFKQQFFDEQFTFVPKLFSYDAYSSSLDTLELLKKSRKNVTCNNLINTLLFTLLINNS